jgi:hypothetical protein
LPDAYRLLEAKGNAARCKNPLGRNYPPPSVVWPPLGLPWEAILGLRGRMMVEGNVDRGKSWWWAFISVLGTLELKIYKERDQEMIFR